MESLWSLYPSSFASSAAATISIMSTPTPTHFDEVTTKPRGAWKRRSPASAAVMMITPAQTRRSRRC
ncbi:hypothetical protein BDA96_03G253300 [Sorghum bicolor]|uniref:Uncharacterized protein n=1 Tax=Sorghum bicolor TaxID=4558 RepID=A0A921UR19_SORBI|nr:hypothetical protein BDA96_03G253300 [Sorghum bicolor]